MNEFINIARKSRKKSGITCLYSSAPLREVLICNQNMLAVGLNSL